MSSRRLQDMSSRHLQEMSSRRLQDMSSTRLEDVFNVTIFRLPRRLQDVLQDVFKMSLQDVSEDVKLLRWRRVEAVLKTCLEDVFKINKCLLGCRNSQFVSTNCVFQQNSHIRKLGETTFYAVVADGLWTNLFKFWSSFNAPSTDVYWEPCQTSKMEHFAKVVNGFKGTSADM